MTSATGWNNPKGPTRLGPIRIWKRLMTRLSK